MTGAGDQGGRIGHRSSPNRRDRPSLTGGPLAGPCPGAFTRSMTSIIGTFPSPAPSRPALAPTERAAVALAVVATAAFGTYGVATGSPSTLSYVFTVSALIAGVLGLRRAAVPGPLALALAALTAAHMAGGLVRVGDGVLYNASLWTEAFQYDHLVHASGVFAGTLVVWSMFGSSLAASGVGKRPAMIALWVLGGLGLGAANETIEFVVTLINHGSQVGGYTNTGWDLVSNVVGVSAAARVITRAGRSQAGKPPWSHSAITGSLAQ